MSSRWLLVLLVTLAITSEASSFRDPIYRETEVRRSRPRIAGEKFDPQESDPKLRAVFSAADAAAERRVGNVKRDEQFVFRFWAEKKKILRQKFAIDWRTPGELNPHIAYDSYGQRKITQRESREIIPVIRKRTSRSITTIERDFHGKVIVWTKPDAHRESLAYVVRLDRGTWKIIDVETWLP
jgi:hypothetical protein